MEKSPPAIPAKRYFTIGEVSELCGVKPYVLRYWEQEFAQLKPMKRRGNRRYYQHHEVLLVRRIRELLYEHGFTISGARNQLGDAAGARGDDSRRHLTDTSSSAVDDLHLIESAAGHIERRGGIDSDANEGHGPLEVESKEVASTSIAVSGLPVTALSLDQVRQELISIRGLLTV